MRRDPVSGKSVPDTLGELLHYFEGEFDPRIIGGAERKGDVLEAVHAMIDATPGGARARLTQQLDFESLCGMLVVKSMAFARARIRESQEALEPNDQVMATAGMVVLHGTSQQKEHFAQQLEAACRHPAVHPEKHPGLKKLADWVRGHVT